MCRGTTLSWLQWQVEEHVKAYQLSHPRAFVDVIV